MSNSTSVVNCGSGGGADTFPKLRIASVFIILIGSMSGALFPVLAKRSSWLRVPKAVFECVFLNPPFAIHVEFHISFAKYFGSGVIVRSTHLHGGNFPHTILFSRLPRLLYISSHLHCLNSKIHAYLQLGPYM